MVVRDSTLIDFESAAAIAVVSQKMHTTVSRIRRANRADRQALGLMALEKARLMAIDRKVRVPVNEVGPAGENRNRTGTR